jgi:integrase
VPYEVRDAGCRGLRVTVQASGTKGWYLRYWHQGKGYNLWLGSVLEGATDTTTAPAIGTPLSLADARMLAAQVLREVKAGRDPGTLRRLGPSEGTVSSIADDYFKRAASKLRSAKARRYDLDLIRGAVGSRPIVEVKLSDLARLRDKVEEEHGPAAADRMLTTWSAFAEWHAGRNDDYRPPSIRKLRVKPPARERVLSDSELRAVWQAADKLGYPNGHLVKLLLLTCGRLREVAGMRRTELSDDGATWTIPAARCKTGRDVVLPLSETAQGIIASAPVIEPGDFVFTSTGKTHIGSFDARKNAIVAASGVTGWRLHDLRRTSRTLLSRAGVSTDVAERCLGHAIGGVRGVYDRHRYLQEMAEAFEALAGMVEQLVNITKQ